MSKIQICVFAYNLEHHIEKSINSIIKNQGNYSASIYIMANGCKDKTAEVAYKIAKKNKKVHVVELSIGDKSNAWNIFTYDYYDHSSIPIFVDGDLEFENDAIKNIIDFHLSHPAYNSISSFPFEHGRSSIAWRKELLEKHQFTGNLYLLSQPFISKIISQDVKLPVGLIGDDSMLGYLSATNLEQNSDRPKQRIGVCQSAIFTYEPLAIFSIKDIKLYLRRRVRYSTRYMQQSSIVPNLKVHGLSAMPEDASTISKELLPAIRWKSSNLIFDIIAKHKLSN
ncbi:glycosyltransferase family A protein [Photobacterium sanguinicancri]|uniref:Glycosyltransferase family A protein n=1 Tax=Photobacterium sanguinicancri TaxID=875932 RepID=A0AAW7Y2R6_9GAMM|nr:glycosyltransferase family A protein [Photobacterium sanguinicancri]MDO6542036.1 glycosyltransferase family A protein [Photobacterium sanguinicancri]